MPYAGGLLTAGPHEAKHLIPELLFVEKKEPRLD
jgi:hypothetical protein